MAGYEAFDIADVEKQQSSDGKGYREFLRRPSVSMGLYLLPAGGEDGQHPHAADEVYVVQRGKARLEVEGESYEVGPGSVVSVERGRDHHFTDITEDLSIIVVFAPPDTPDTA